MRKVYKMKSGYNPKGVEKVKIGLYIRKDVDQQFREYIAQKYGTVERGLLSFEIEQAMQAWVGTHKSVHALELTAPNPLKKVYEVKEQVKEYLRNQMGYMDVFQVPLVHIGEAIGAVRGTDNRTIKKWLATFEKYHVIKRLSPHVVEFL